MTDHRPHYIQIADAQFAESRKRAAEAEAQDARSYDPFRDGMLARHIAELEADRDRVGGLLAAVIAIFAALAVGLTIAAFVIGGAM